MRRTRSLAPDAVTRSLRVRVGRLGEGAATLAQALAVLGDDVPLRQAAALAGMAPRNAAAAADALAGVEVLLPREPLQYVHPLVRHAIEQDIPVSERATRHLDAARLLYAEGESAERVAAHLVVGRAEGSDWTVNRLRAAAREAQLRGVPRSAVDYLRRALEEPPTPLLRTDVLAELGEAEASLGEEDAAEHLAAAVLSVNDPCRRAELALLHGNGLYRLGRYAEAAGAYEQGQAELRRADLSTEQADLMDNLSAGYIATAALVPDLRARAVARSAELLDGVQARPRSAGQRRLLAQAALQAAYAGKTAAEVGGLAERAWDGGELLAQDGVDGLTWTLVAEAQNLTGDLERALELCDSALASTRQPLSPGAHVNISLSRALPTLWQGRVTDAIDALRMALEAARYGPRRFTRSGRATLALCLIERDELAGAGEQLAAAGDPDALRDLEDAYCLSVRAQLHLQRGEAESALADALRAGQAIGPEIRTLAHCPWRTVGALAALGLGRRSEALELAQTALELADQTQVAHQQIRTRWVLGLCEEPARGMALLEQAAELGRSAPARLETIRALVELGSALRRANRRAAAREPLQQASDLALAGGATALGARAHTELSAAGSRPRREWLLSGPESLTPSERRIAELAAGGQSNREIAQTLFVTPKTVEYHLRNTYRKLDIGGRGDLAAALTG